VQLLGKENEGNYVIHVNETVLQDCCEDDSTILGLSCRAEIARNFNWKKNKFRLIFKFSLNI